MKKILTVAAAAGGMSVKAIWTRPRNEMFYFYPGESNWMNPFPGGEYTWVHEGATLLDARASFHFYATGITPAMAKKIIGKGWNTIFRLYRPLERWYDKTWRPGEIELVHKSKADALLANEARWYRMG